MGYAKPTAARLIDQRARRRATQALIDSHREEFRDLYEWHRRNAAAEAQTLAVKASETHPTTHRTAEPPRLMTGRRKPGQDVTERIDVARCPQCVRYHDHGHVCGKCGSEPQKPADAPSIPRDRIDAAILRMVERGDSDAKIAFDLCITEEAVRSRRQRLRLEFGERA